MDSKSDRETVLNLVGTGIMTAKLNGTEPRRERNSDGEAVRNPVGTGILKAKRYRTP